LHKDGAGHEISWVFSTCTRSSPPQVDFFYKKKSSTKVVYYHFAPEKEGKELWYIISISTLVLYKALLPYIGPKCGGYKNRKQKNKVARILHI